jgi:GPH family glycoside/pentoside/hexuronide:cation symporter
MAKQVAQSITTDVTVPELSSDARFDSSSKDAIPIKEKIAYGAGGYANQAGESAVNNLITPVYNLILGVDPKTIGIALGGMRIWDAITDPIMGNISDNWKKGSGRRKPFMLIGAILLTFVFPLLWWASPQWNDNAIVAYMIAGLLIFYTCYTVYSVPFRALGAEMTPNYDERSKLQVVTSYFNELSQMSVPWIFPAATLAFWNGPETGIKVVTAVSGVVILITGLIASRIPEERYRKVAQKQEKVKIIPAFKNFLSDSTFLYVHGIGVALLGSLMIVGTLGMYINIFYVFGGDWTKGSTYSAISANIASVMGFVVLYTLRKKFMHVEKKKIIAFALLLTMVGSSLKWFLFNPEHPNLVFILPFFMSVGQTCFWTIWISMLADYNDYDEYKHGNRREGMFNAASGWMMKATSSISLALSGFVLAVTGFDKDKGGAQGEETYLMMRVLFIALPLILLVTAFVMNMKYPLTKTKMLEIRQELERRRGSIS